MQSLCYSNDSATKNEFVQECTLYYVNTIMSMNYLHVYVFVKRLSLYFILIQLFYTGELKNTLICQKRVNHVLYIINTLESV